MLDLVTVWSNVAGTDISEEKALRAILFRRACPVSLQAISNSSLTEIQGHCRHDLQIGSLAHDLGSV